MKLSTHSQGNSGWPAFNVLDVLASRAEYAKWIDPPAAAARKVRDLGIRLIVRHYGAWDNDWSLFDPAAFVADCQSQEWWTYAWAIESPNEPHPGDTLQLSNLVIRLANEGKQCIVGNWGTGWDGVWVPGAKYYGCHEYGRATLLDSTPWHALRYRSWFPSVLANQPDAQLFITECGVTQALDGGPDIGYRANGTTPAEYWATSLLPYNRELEKDTYVRKAFVYQFGANTDWETFECAGTEIEQLLIASYKEGLAMGPDLKDTYSAEFTAWWNAGGWRNFASFLVATGSIDATQGEIRTLVKDRLESSVKEAVIFMDAL